jgi:hypothetical protein
MAFPPTGLFRPDPRIKRRRRFADTFTQAGLKRIAPAPGTSVYGFSPWGEAGNRLANILGAQMLESSAERREQEQMAARGQVLAQLLKVGSARPDQLIQTQMQEPGPGAMMRTQYSIGNDGAQISTLDPAIMKTAGLDPAMYQTALATAKAQGDTLTQARLERDINRELSSVLGQENPDMALAAQLNALVRPKEELAEVRKKAAAATKAAATRAGASPKKWEAHRKSLLQTYDLTNEEAEDIVFGNKRINRNPITQVLTLVNIRTGEIEPLTVKEPVSKPADGKPAKRGLYARLEEGPDITGIVAGLQITGEEVGSQLEPLIPGIAGSIADKGQIQLKTEFDLSVKDLKLALAKNPKYAVAEQDEIDKRLNLDTGLLVGKGALLLKLQGAASYLRKKLKEDLRNARDASLPSEDRRMALGSARAIEDFLNRMAIPKSAEEMSDEELRKIK